MFHLHDPTRTQVTLLHSLRQVPVGPGLSGAARPSVLADGEQSKQEDIRQSCDEGALV